MTPWDYLINEGDKAGLNSSESPLEKESRSEITRARYRADGHCISLQDSHCPSPGSGCRPLSRCCQLLAKLGRPLCSHCACRKNGARTKTNLSDHTHLDIQKIPSPVSHLHYLEFHSLAYRNIHYIKLTVSPLDKRTENKVATQTVFILYILTPSGVG